MVDLQPGDILLSFNTTNAFSEAIADLTHSKWSHVMMYIGHGNVVESTIGGVRITPVKHYLTNKFHVKHLRVKDITPEQAQKLVKDVLKLLGKDYGYMQIVWLLFLRLIGQSENPKWQKDVEPNAMVCSEAIAYVLQLEGWYVKKGFDTSCIEPADFAESQIFVKV